MELVFKSPEDIASEYLLHLKTLKPEINDRQEDSDWFIKANVVGGVVAGAYSDAKKISEDAFPQSARREALEKHLFVYFGEGFKQPTQSHGFAVFTGATGTIIPAGIQMAYTPNNNIYITDEEGTLATTGGFMLPITSVDSGQDQNLLSGATLALVSPVGGLDTTATASGDIAGGRDVESDEEAATRILARIREPIRGGTEGDYYQWALEADDAVTDASVLRYPMGLGTVGIIITSGTTDIDKAIDNGDAISFLPPQDLVEKVEAYLETKRPLTDCVKVFSPIPIVQDVTGFIKFSQGDQATIISGQELNQGELVRREITRGLYHTPIGGYPIGASGFVLASKLEETIDLSVLMATALEGIPPIILDRQIHYLSTSGYNRRMLANEYVIPGKITILEF